MNEAVARKASEAIPAGNLRFGEALGRGDAQALAGLYTEDAMVMPTGSPPVVGTAAIQAFWQAVIDSGIKGAKLEAVEIDECGATAIEVGNYTLLAAGDQVADRGKYIVVWKQQHGQWKLHRDIFNTNQAAPA